jgi:integrase
MGRRRTGEPPRYRLHRQSGQAIVSLPLGNRKYQDILLGLFDSPESKQEYARVVAEWAAHGPTVAARRTLGNAPTLSVNELILAYWPHVEQYYRHPDGTPTQEVDNIRLALRRLRQHYGIVPADVFDSLALEALRTAMIQEGLCRGRINKDMGRVKRLFTWAASKKLVPVSVVQLLATVKGLRAGRSEAKEMEPVRPVDDAVVEETLPHLTPPVQTMVQLQRATGMRPGEVVVMRGIDLDISGSIWTYRPGSDQGPHGKHKTAWRGHTRTVLIGPRGQELLRPWFRLNLTDFLFQPREGRDAYNAERRANRKTPFTPSQLKRTLKTNPKRKPHDRYSVMAYDHAVMNGCIKAHAASCPTCKRMEQGKKKESRKDWLKRVRECSAFQAFAWHPNQLRHSVATKIRKAAGLDAARAVLGHRSPAITEVYAELDVGTAAEIVKRLG